LAASLSARRARVVNPVRLFSSASKAELHNDSHAVLIRAKLSKPVLNNAQPMSTEERLIQINYVRYPTI